jgi:NAD(P)-dependent dehydrogenase (short-subunit alcohol dehydrogenase family)
MSAAPVAFVTGAASGIGAAIVDALLARSVRVVAVDLRAPEHDHPDVTGMAVDVTDRAAVEGAIAATIERHGRLDQLFNNAGVMDDFGPVADLDDAMWERNFRVNVDGPMYACRAAIPQMLEQGGGAIVNTASLAALAGGRAGVAYTASKHAVAGLTKAIAFHYGDRGIRCNAVCPGSTRPSRIMKGTEFNQGGLERAEQLLATVPEATTPDRQAAVAVFLASDGAAYVNGAVLPVDGGWLAA